MTTIGAVGLKSGFVIAADGRMKIDDADRATAGPDILKLESEKAQKIFEITNADKTLAYALSGSLGDPRHFNLLQEIQTQIGRFATRRFDDCWKYLSALGEKINVAMNEAKRNGRTKFPEAYKLEGSTAWRILDVAFVGYFNSFPSFALLQFFNFGELSEFRVTSRSPLGAMLCGSELVRKGMYSDNAQPLPNSPFAPVKTLGPSFEDAKDFLTGYIAACSSDIARQLDYERWKDTGGHIHVAKITRENGFEWMVAPLTASALPGEVPG